MSMVVGPPPLIEQPLPDLLLRCSGTMLGGCLHSGRPLVSDGFCWAKMAEAALLTVGTDALAGGMTWVTWRGLTLTLVC